MSLHSTPTDASNTELRHKYKYKNTIRAYGRRPASLDKKNDEKIKQTIREKYKNVKLKRSKTITVVSFK